MANGDRSASSPGETWLRSLEIGLFALLTLAVGAAILLGFYRYRGLKEQGREQVEELMQLPRNSVLAVTVTDEESGRVRRIHETEALRRFEGAIAGLEAYRASRAKYERSWLVVVMTESEEYVFEAHTVEGNSGWLYCHVIDLSPDGTRKYLMRVRSRTLWRWFEGHVIEGAASDGDRGRDSDGQQNPHAEPG